MTKEINLSLEERLYLQIMEDLHKSWQPHAGQIKAGKALYQEGKRNLFVQCGRKWGKDLSLNTCILTDSGFKPLREIKEEDVVYTHTGHETTVTWLSPIRKVDTYRLHFNDGTYLDSSITHSWLAYHGRSRKLQKVTTKEILEEMKKESYKDRPTKIPLCITPQHNKKELPIDPYVLGAWLGDGSHDGGRFTSENNQIPILIKARGYIINEGKDKYAFYIKDFVQKLKKNNLYKNKHIPSIYLLGSPEQRLDLFKGLMDTDGTIDDRGTCEFVQKRKELFDQVVSLGRSLGLRINVMKPKIINGETYYKFRYSSSIQTFSLPRKASKVKHKKKGNTKTILAIKHLPPQEMRCIAVDHSDHTYITEDYTVTHNSEFCIYTLWRHALLNPGSACYYLCPQQKQAKEIVWASRRLQSFCDAKYVKKIDNTELRITFTNGSFIKLDGSDNYESYRGITPHFVVYDEFKDFHPRFHEGMAPNLAVKKAPLIMIGTPPDRMCQYTTMADECRVRQDSFFIRQPSWENPHIDKQWLASEKEKLHARGEEEVWYREYEAKFVLGGARSVFPMFDRERHIRPHGEIMREIGRDLSRLLWAVVADPGSTTVFGVLFMVWHPYTKKLYILDEMYESDQINTSIRVMYPKIESICGLLYPNSSIDDDWTKTYDEAAAWFSTEVMQQYGVYFSPTQKHLHKKDFGLSQIKDQLLHDIVVISDRCAHLCEEIENYVTGPDGKFPKNGDHLIDCWRYGNASLHFDVGEVLSARKQEGDERRFFSLHDEVREMNNPDDWVAYPNWWNK